TRCADWSNRTTLRCCAASAFASGPPVTSSRKPWYHGFSTVSFWVSSSSRTSVAPRLSSVALTRSVVTSTVCVAGADAAGAAGTTTAPAGVGSVADDAVLPDAAGADGCWLTVDGRPNSDGCPLCRVHA